MSKRRTIKAILTAATIAVAVALPVGTAGAASAATASPQVHTRVPEGYYPNLAWCETDGNGYILTDYASGYECDPQSGGYILWVYFD